MPGIVAVSETLIQPGNDPETAKAAEESLPTIGKRLTRNDAIFLLRVHNWGNERVSAAIENAWAARGITQDDIAKEMDWIARETNRAIKEETNRIANEEKNRRAAAVQAAKEVDARSEIQALCLKLLHPGNDPEGAKAAEDSLLKLLPAVGSGLTPRDAFFLDDVRRSGNKRLSPAIEFAWEASGFTQYFAAKEKYMREHNGQEMAGKMHVRDMPEQWQRFMMTPDSPKPDFSDRLFNGPVGDGVSNAERRRNEIERQNRERAANRVR